jgi:hypothetical protein
MNFRRSLTAISLLALMVAGVATAPQASARSFDAGSSSCSGSGGPITCHLYHFKLVGQMTITVVGFDGAGKTVVTATARRHNSANIYIDEASAKTTSVSIALPGSSPFYGPKKFTNNIEHCYDTFYSEFSRINDGYSAVEVADKPCNDK